MESIRTMMEYAVWGVTVGQLGGAFVAVLLGFIARAAIRILAVHLAKAATRSRTSIDDVLLASVKEPLGWGAVLVGIYIAVQILPIPQEPVNVAYFLHVLAKGCSILLVVWFAIGLTDRLLDQWAQKAAQTDSKLDDQAIPIIKSTTKVFLILVGAAMFLQNLGYSVGSLIAGLGLGGAALALASKDTLSNLFGAIVIFWDQPFAVGDWVEIGSVEGTVEEVGLRTTRVRTFANSLITMPNMNLTTSAINNWSRMKKRRIKMTVGVTYGTPPAKVQAGVEAIREIIRNTAAMHKDFFLVNFDAFGPSSLDIFIYCFTVTTSWADFLQAKEDFLVQIMERFEALGLEFAFPTQTVHVASFAGEPEALKEQRPK